MDFDKINKNEFFKEATLRICGNLEIEKAMFACLKYMNKLIPLSRIYLEIYDPSYGSMRIIATATEDSYKKLDILAPLSEDARVSANKYELPGLDNVFVFEDPDEFPISREILSFLDVRCTSLMVMLLGSRQKALGAIVFLTQGKEKYVEKHASLLSLLKGPFTIAMSNSLKHREVMLLKELLDDDNRFLQSELRRISGDEIIGTNFGLREVMDDVQKVSPLGSPVLLIGETGTGKDVIANAIHSLSPRCNGPFICVNCGSIPETLIDSELFGHEKGAFTGAISQKRGRFERAHKGTIFLDEIGELPLQLQVRLLRVLQNKVIERVGGTKTISLDIRVIVATNRDLEAMVKHKEFREDLWFRINVFPILIPPLRHRREDIPALLHHFVNLKSKELKLPSFPEILPDAIDILMDYNWPGNVREIENIVERALILNPRGPIDFSQMNIGKKNRSGTSPLHKNTDLLDDVVTNHIRSVLSRTNGRIHGISGAADILGINPSTLRNRMKKLGILYGRAVKD